eukprot:COSAG01_NODE_1384_length_10514_cov_17.435046_3_plen_184_part_00
MKTAGGSPRASARVLHADGTAALVHQLQAGSASQLALVVYLSLQSTGGAGDGGVGAGAGEGPAPEVSTQPPDERSEDRNGLRAPPHNPTATEHTPSSHRDVRAAPAKGWWEMRGGRERIPVPALVERIECHAQPHGTDVRLVGALAEHGVVEAADPARGGGVARGAARLEARTLPGAFPSSLA